MPVLGYAGNRAGRLDREPAPLTGRVIVGQALDLGSAHGGPVGQHQTQVGRSAHYRTAVWVDLGPVSLGAGHADTLSISPPRRNGRCAVRTQSTNRVDLSLRGVDGVRHSMYIRNTMNAATQTGHPTQCVSLLLQSEKVLRDGNSTSPAADMMIDLTAAFENGEPMPSDAPAILQALLLNEGIPTDDAARAARWARAITG